MYIDGFLAPVAKDKVAAYREHSRKCSEVWKEHGAVDYVECVGDDVPHGTLTSFPRAVQLQDDEVVIFAWIAYPSRAVRDACNAAVMADPRMQALGEEMKTILDGKRMVWGGFEAVLQV